MKQKIKAYLAVGISSWNADQLSIQSYDPDMTDLAHRSVMKLRELELEVDVPVYDINAMKVEAIEAVMIKEKADFQVRQNLLLDQISKLKCITQEQK